VDARDKELRVFSKDGYPEADVHPLVGRQGVERGGDEGGDEGCLGQVGNANHDWPVGKGRKLSEFSRVSFFFDFLIF
jgi:hypothetical protein